MMKKTYLLISEKPSLMRLVKSAYEKCDVHDDIDVDFMALHGHCCTLAPPQYYDKKYEKWEMADLPIVPATWKHVPVEKELVNDIKKQLKSKKYDGLINCTDAEREGQNIFYSLYDYLGLKLPVLRFWANDLTELKLIEAWHNLKDDQHDTFLVNLTNEALLRAEFDWLVGMNFSRVVSIANYRAIPIGRVMTVVLAMLAKREDEINNFVPTETYDVIANYKVGFDGKYKPDDENKSGAFKTREEAEAFLNTLSKKASVKEAKFEQVKKKAPLLYSLGDLQNDANKTYGYTLHESLEIIQGLYEKKILSYPRTDSNYLTTGEAKRMREILNAVALLPNIDINVSEKAINDYAKSAYVDDKKVQAHYAIVFTGEKFKYDSLNSKERNILTLVARRIVATMMPVSVIEKSKIVCEIGDDKHRFVSTDSKLIDAGWQTLYGKQNEPESILHKAYRGDVLDVVDYDVRTVTSVCPLRYTDASINKAMINVGTTLSDKELAAVLKGTGSKDQGGIGTPATRSQIIEKLLVDRKNGKTSTEPWVVRKNKAFCVTDSGMSVAKALNDYSVSSAILTAQWEKKLKDVENGDLSPKDFETDMLEYITSECENLKTASIGGRAKSAERSTPVTNYLDKAICPVCGRRVKKTAKYYLCENYKADEYPCTFILGQEISGAKLNDKDVIDMCNGKQSRTRQFLSKNGKHFTATLSFEGGKVQFNFVNKPQNKVSRKSY